MAPSRHPFAIRDFRYYWTARLASTIAQMSMVIVIGWQVYDIARRTMDTHEAALQLGLIGLVQFVPLFLLTLVTGWTADRIDRRVIARAAIGLELICAAILGWLAWAGTTTLADLFAVAGLLGVARAFAGPALGALAPNLVPREILPRAIAMSSIAWQSGAIAGPALGGYLYAWAPHMPYAVSGGLCLISLICMFMIRPIERTEIDRTRNPWQQMVDGLHYVRQNRLVLGAISLDLFAVLLGGATAMLPVFARDILHAGPEGLGHLRAAPAIGATLTAILFSYRPLKHDVGVKMLVAVGVFGGATIGFGLSRWMPLSLACLALLGAADMLSVYVRQSLIQLHTPNEMRGRVGAASTLFISASNELGEAESGFLAALIGPVTAVIAGGIGAVAITLLWARIFPELRLARSFDVPKKAGEAPIINASDEARELKT
ncbi:MAG: transporter [Alphaproteobacteria bacterium]|nr:transporter [Alphaproteobacteria bacterium]